jgi:hypothetical protein
MGSLTPVAFHVERPVTVPTLCSLCISHAASQKVTKLICPPKHRQISSGWLCFR